MLERPLLLYQGGACESLSSQPWQSTSPTALSVAAPSRNQISEPAKTGESNTALTVTLDTPS